MGDMADQNIQDGFDNLFSDDTCEHGYDIDGRCPDCDKEEDRGFPEEAGPEDMEDA